MFIGSVEDLMRAKFKIITTYSNKDNETICKLCLLDKDGDIINTFFGKAKLSPNDTYDSKIGSRIAELRASQKAHKYIIALANHRYSQALKEVNSMSKVLDYEKQKVTNIDTTIEQLKNYTPMQ